MKHRITQDCGVDRCLPQGLGCSLERKGKTVHGKWNSCCSGEHVNVLEVRAVYLALLELLLLIWNRHLLVKTDHISVVILTGPFKVLLILLTAPKWLGRWWFPTIIYLLYEPLQPLPVEAGRVDLPVKSDNVMTVDMAAPQLFPLELEKTVVQTIYRPGPCLHATATANSGTYPQDGVTANSWSLPHLHFKFPSITSSCQESIQ